MILTLSKSLGWLCDPMIAFLVLLVVIVVFASERTLTLLLLCLIVGMGVISISPLPEFLVQNLETEGIAGADIPYKEYAVVLGGDNIHYIKKSDQFDYTDSFDRVGEAFRLYRKKKIGKIIVTGGDVPFAGEMVNEAKSAAEWLKAMGAKAEDILLETKSRSTYENAALVKEIIDNNKISDFYLITSASHMKRSLHTFRKLGMNPTPFSVDFKVHGGADGFSWNSLGLTKLNLFKLALHEYVGMAYYSLVY